ncbi:MAG TPA: hypothetical protein VF469_05110 [Kofleriaceae bacterium]
MRDLHTIASEIDRARHDLDDSLGALKALVRDKLDVKQRARNAIDRGLHEVGEVVRRIWDRARQHPAIATLATCAALAVAYVYVRRHRDCD